jgi:hypothetical protein
MKLFKKILLIFLSFLLFVVLVVASALWYLFTPENLTPLINSQAKDYLKCEAIIKKVEPTFFGSYPFFGIEINNLCLRESEKQNDTIIYAKKCLASVDVMAFLNDNNIILNPFYLENGYVNFKVKKDGTNNLDVLKPSENPEPPKQKEKKEASSFSLGNINLNNFELRNFNANYIDHKSNMEAKIENLDIELSFDYQSGAIDLESEIKLGALLFNQYDSSEIYSEGIEPKLTAKINDLALDLDAEYAEDDLDLKTNIALQAVKFNTNDSASIDTDLKEIKLSLKASDKSKDNYKAKLELEMPAISFSMQNQKLLSNLNFNSRLPIEVDIKKQAVNLNDVRVQFNQQVLELSGKARMYKNKDIETDIEFATNEWNVDNLLALIPKSYQKLLDGIFVKGVAQISGTVKGKKTQNKLPIITTKFKYKKGEAQYKEFPKVHKFNTSLFAYVDLNNKANSYTTIDYVNVGVMNNDINLNGKVSNFMNKPIVDLKLGGVFNVPDFQQYVPDSLNMDVYGKIKTQIHTKLNLAKIEEKKFNTIFLDGKIDTENFAVIMNDTTSFSMPSASIELDLPTHQNVSFDSKLGTVNISLPIINVILSEKLSALTHNFNINIDINDLIEGYKTPQVDCNFNIGKVSASADKMAFYTQNFGGELNYKPIPKDSFEIVDVKSILNSGSLEVVNEDTTILDVKKFTNQSAIIFDKTKDELFEKIKANIDLGFLDGHFNFGKKLKGKIPNISVAFAEDTVKVKKANVVLGNSDFNLYGQVNNIAEFIKTKDLLKGELDFVSEKTDITQLMDIFNGMGRKDTTVQVKENEKVPLDSTGKPKKTDPFMVPKGVDFRLNTNIKKTVVNNHLIENIKGGLTIKDGVLILEEMGFTSRAANMQLTAIYESPRKNHLYTSFDFHLLNINIEELISLVPYVDTIVPMLKSFKGTGEFHLSAETNLFSDYTPKKSTILGASAFEGYDLVLLDNSTFDNIASKLMFEKKTENRVDSLSVEMTIFKDKVELFPFLIKMDDYSAVIAGVQTPKKCNYHISLTDCPLPVYLGLDVKGPITDLEYNLASCRYKKLYRPDKKGVVDDRILRFKKIIKNSLKSNVKPIE